MTVPTAGFSDWGRSGGIWLLATAFKDYVIISAVGQTTLTVLARQSPGPTQLTRSAHTSYQGG